ncbi:MAG: sulfotransferase family protein [bacterium]
MHERKRIPGPCAHLDFVIIGAMKAGSTSLFEFLAEHPAVIVPSSKEPHYFSMRYYLPSLYYRSLFSSRASGQICGEASTSYSNVNRFPLCPERIAKDAPNARIIYMIRDPIDRILSNLRHLQLRGYDTGIDSQAVRDPSLWNKSRYRDTIEAYLEFLPRARLFVADLRDLQKDDEWLRRIVSFLELDPQHYDKFELPQSNVSSQRNIRSRWINQFARSPLGALLRDILPSESIKKLKDAASNPSETENAGGSDSKNDGLDINEEMLRSRFPEECEQLDSQYQWVRKHFIDASDHVTKG